MTPIKCAHSALRKALAMTTIFFRAMMMTKFTSLSILFFFTNLYYLEETAIYWTNKKKSMASTAGYTLQRSPPSSGSVGSLVSDNNEYSSPATSAPTVLLLSGWTPGPMNYLRSRLQKDIAENGVVVIVEPKLLMPPWRGFWCWDLNFIVMLGVVALLLAGLWQVLVIGPNGTGEEEPPSQSQKVLYASLLLGILCYWIRLMVAVVARSAQQDGVEKCLKEMKRRNVVLCVGFSWGAGVLSELLTRDKNGLDSQPAFLLMAPVSAAASMAAMRPDAAERLHLLVQEDDHDCMVHVVHASDDPIFCPHPERWEQVVGIQNTTVVDNHTFSKRSSRQMIGDIMTAMFRAKTGGNP